MALLTWLKEREIYKHICSELRLFVPSLLVAFMSSFAIIWSSLAFVIMEAHPNSLYICFVTSWVILIISAHITLPVFFLLRKGRLYFWVFSSIPAILAVLLYVAHRAFYNHYSALHMLPPLKDELMIHWPPSVAVYSYLIGVFGVVLFFTSAIHWFQRRMFWRGVVASVLVWSSYAFLFFYAPLCLPYFSYLMD